MTDFSSQLNSFKVKVFRMERDVFHGVTEEVQRSIVEGSELTASEGQLVDTGALRASWVGQFTSATEWQCTTHLAYAPSIEDGVSYAHGGTPLTKRSQTGNFHSVKLTRVGFPRIVEFVVRKVRGQ